MSQSYSIVFKSATWFSLCFGLSLVTKREKGVYLSQWMIALSFFDIQTKQLFVIYKKLFGNGSWIFQNSLNPGASVGLMIECLLFIYTALIGLIYLQSTKDMFNTILQTKDCRIQLVHTSISSINFNRASFVFTFSNLNSSISAWILLISSCMPSFVSLNSLTF